MIEKLEGYVVYYALELLKCSAQPKLHDSLFVHLVTAYKCTFVLAIRMHKQLVVTIVRVDILQYNLLVV